MVKKLAQSSLGRALDSLLPEIRAFVVAWVERGDGNRVAAMREANYGGPNRTDDSLASAAFYLLKKPKVQEAIRELTLAKLASAGPMVTAQLLHIARNGKKESDQLRALELIMNRIGLHAITEHHVKTEDTAVTREMMERELKILIARNPDAAKLLPDGVQRLLAARPLETVEENVVEGEFVEVDVDAEMGL